VGPLICDQGGIEISGALQSCAGVEALQRELTNRTEPSGHSSTANGVIDRPARAALRARRAQKFTRKLIDPMWELFVHRPMIRGSLAEPDLAGHVAGQHIRDRDAR
jgi:hypothetical protein